MEPLDGNALAGPLYEHFGREMTAVWGSCTHCGTSSQLAQLRVYTPALGSVAHCPTCGTVVIVIVQIRDELHVYGSGFELAPEGTAGP